MRQSAIILALGVSAALATSPVLADKEKELSFRYVAQENCVGAPDFTPFPDVDPYNYPWIGWQDYGGTLIFDLSNHIATWTHQGTFLGNLGYSANPPGQPSGIHNILFWTSDGQCQFNFELSPDLSFSLQSTSAGCHAHLLNGPNAGTGDTVFNKRWTGQFAPDMYSFIARHAGWDSQQQPVVETQQLDNGYVQKRICTSIVHGVKVYGDKDKH
jgi:hypothetical protein